MLVSASDVGQSATIAKFRSPHGYLKARTAIFVNTVPMIMLNEKVQYWSDKKPRSASANRISTVTLISGRFIRKSE